MGYTVTVDYTGNFKDVMVTHFSVFGDQFPIRVEDCTGIVQFVPITFWYTACIVMAGIYSTMGYPIAGGPTHLTSY